MEQSSPHHAKSDPLASGTIVGGRYEVVRLLGNGAMGSVYLVQDVVLNDEEVALKVMHPEFAYTQTHSQRFLREVQLMRKITHKNVVRTFDVGTEKDTVYFTMEYIHGTPLDRLLGKLDENQLADICIQTCEGLEVIHAAGIVHRDLKPANLIIAEDGTLKITDFGVARPEVSNLTAHNEVVGSAAYMAPEVWMAKKLTPAVDLYALGIVLYEVFTGQLPFDADSPGAVMRLHLDRTPKPIRDLHPNVSPWFNKFVLKLLEKSPGDRYRSARDVAEYVRGHIRAHETIASGQLEDTLAESDSLLAQLEELSKSATALPTFKNITRGDSGDKNPNETIDKTETGSLKGTGSISITNTSSIKLRKSKSSGTGRYFEIAHLKYLTQIRTWIWALTLVALTLWALGRLL